MSKKQPLPASDLFDLSLSYLEDASQNLDTARKSLLETGDVFLAGAILEIEDIQKRLMNVKTKLAR